MEKNVSLQKFLWRRKSAALQELYLNRLTLYTDDSPLTNRATSSMLQLSTLTTFTKRFTLDVWVLQYLPLLQNYFNDLLVVELFMYC